MEDIEEDIIHFSRRHCHGNVRGTRRALSIFRSGQCRLQNVGRYSVTLSFSLSLSPSCLTNPQQCTTWGEFVSFLAKVRTSRSFLTDHCISKQSILYQDLKRSKERYPASASQDWRQEARLQPHRSGCTSNSYIQVDGLPQEDLHVQSMWQPPRSTYFELAIAQGKTSQEQARINLHRVGGRLALTLVAIFLLHDNGFL